MSFFPGIYRELQEGRQAVLPLPSPFLPAVRERPPAGSGSGLRKASNGVSLGTVGELLEGWEVRLPDLKPAGACRAVGCEARREVRSYCRSCHGRFTVAVVPRYRVGAWGSS
jgi:hypothetical protein